MSEDQGSDFEAPEAPSEVDQEINKLMHDPKSPYYDDKHPGHKEAVAQIRRLYAQKYPEEAETPQPIEEKGDPDYGRDTQPIPGINLPKFPQGQEADLEAIQGFIPIAKEIGLSMDEIQVEIDAFAIGDSTTPASYTEDEGVEALNQRWGSSASQIVAQAKKFIDELPEGTRAKMDAWLESTGLGSNPKIIEALARRQAVKEGGQG